MYRIYPFSDFALVSFNENINQFTFKPHSKLYVKNINGNYIIRKVNSDGFLDNEHLQTKPNGIFRIGFFGDSYVEAVQVNSENTFTSILADKYKHHNIEIFNFGISGHGTLHSYLKSEYYSEYYNLDLIVYVFCENDMGDQLNEIRPSSTLPFADIKNNELSVDYSFVIKNRYGTNNTFKTLIKKVTFYNKSIILQIIVKKLKKIVHFDKNRKLKNKRELNQNDPPSSWPDNIKKKAMQINKIILSKWNGYVKNNGKEFVIIIVPPENKEQWKKPIKMQDSWAKWLQGFCVRKNINFINPRIDFIIAEKEGEKIYNDHLTEIGHLTLADKFYDWSLDKKIIKY